MAFEYQPEYWIKKGIATEVTFKAALSGGKGGQHVNKVHTKAELYWNPRNSFLLTDEQKEKVCALWECKLSDEGWLRVTSDEERSLLLNKKKGLQKLVQQLAQVFVVPKKRRPSAPTAASKKKKRESKEIQKTRKEGRRKIDPTNF